MKNPDEMMIIAAIGESLRSLMSSGIWTSVGRQQLAAKIQTYKIKDLLRVNETGEIDFERSRILVSEIAHAAASHTDHNILVDLRETVVTASNMTELLQLAIEMALYKSLFQNKIASLVPDEEERIAIAERFKDCLDIKGFEYDFFTDFESALEWLSETVHLH